MLNDEMPISDHLRYSVAACQTDLPNPARAAGHARNTDRILAMIDRPSPGAAPFLPVRLVVFPEFAHAAPVFVYRRRLMRQAARANSKRAHRAARNESQRARHLHPERLDARSRSEISRRRLQHDMPDWAGRYPLQVPQGEYVDSVRSPHQPARSSRLRRAALSRRRHADRPHRLCDLLRLAVSRSDAPACGQRRGGVVRVSAYMDPWGATEPMDWWTIVNRCRALENTAYVVAANQGASLKHYPPYSWPGGSQVVDFDGRSRRSITRTRRADRRRANRRLRTPSRTRSAARPSHAGPPAHRSLPGLSTTPVSARNRDVPLSYENNNRLIDRSEKLL